MRRILYAYYVISLLLAGVFASCGTDDPTSVDRPPVVRYFYPEEQNFDAFVGDTVSFFVVAVDPDETSLKQRFSLNDSVVSSGTGWDYIVTEEGVATIKCVVTDGVNQSRIMWEVNQYTPVNYPPKIVKYTPVESNPVMIIGNELEFGIEAVDPENVPLRYFITLDDSLVSNKSDFVYQPSVAGEHLVKAVVTDGELFDSHKWFLTVTPVPDTIPPARVPITLIETGDEPGEIVVEWTAVGADSMTDVASNYLVRTLPSPMEDELSWSWGSDRPGVPAPAAPGEPMRMVVDGLIPARFTYVAIRAVDDFGNLSPLGESPGVYTRGMRISGRVMNSITGEPLEGQHVHLAHFHTTTDAQGDFEFIELPPLDDPLIVSDDDTVGVLGAYYDYRMEYEVTHLDYIPVYMIPQFQLKSALYDDFLTFFVAMTEQLGLPFPRHQRRFEAPIDVYADPFEHNGLDYQAVVHQATLGLNPVVGFEAFSVVTGVPAVGVHCIYRDDITYDNYGVLVWSDDWYPIQGLIEFRTGYDSLSVVPFQRVIRHELGHALGLGHSEDKNHLMVQGIAPRVDFFSPDEIAVIRTRFHIPRGLPLSTYIRE